MKKILLLALAICSLGAVNELCLNAQTIEDGVLTDARSVKGRYEIPATVTKIADFAFFQGSVSEVVIPASVKEIGLCAFYECTNLVKVEFAPNSRLETMGDQVFDSCTKLTSINLPSGVRKMGHNTFYSDSALLSVVLPEQLEVLPPYTFQSCYKLAQVTIPVGTKVLSENAFAGCRGLTSVAMHGVDSIATKAFYGCLRLESITFPKTLRIVADSAFMNCTALTEVTYPKSLTFSGARVFRGCTQLKSIKVESGNPYLKSENGILYSQDGATLFECPAQFASDKYTLANTVKVIRPYAFFECSLVKGIEIPATIERIGLAALACNGIAEFSFEGNDRYTVHQGGIYYNTQDKDGNAVKVALAYPSKREGDHTVMDGTLLVAQYAFAGCSGLKHLTLPASLLQLDTMSLSGCTGLTDISAYPMTPPSTKAGCFLGVYQPRVSLHVQTAALQAYAMHSEWMLFNFGADLGAVANPVVEQAETSWCRTDRGVDLFPKEGGEYRLYDYSGRIIAWGKVRTGEVLHLDVQQLPALLVLPEGTIKL